MQPFITKTGVGTVAADGKETKLFDGELYVMEKALHADLAIIKCWKADEAGNVVYDKTAQNINPIMATAAKLTVCEVEEIVNTGTFDANHIHTPGIYVHRLVKGEKYEKRIEKLTTRDR